MVGVSLLVLAVLVFQFGVLYSGLALLASFILLRPYKILGEILLGSHIILPTARGRTFFLVEKRRGARREYWYGAYLEFTDIHYGVSDLDVKSFISRARAVLEGIMFDPNANYTFIVKRRNGMTRVFLQVLVRDVDRNALKPRMQSLLRGIGKHLKTYGIESRIARIEDVEDLLKVRKIEKSRRLLVVLGLAILGVLIGLRLRLIILMSAPTGLPDLYLLFLFASLLPLVLYKSGYRVSSPTRVLLSNESVYTIPTPYDVYNSSRWLHSILNTSGDFTLILKLRPAPQVVIDAVESKAYKLYEWGQAFDKLKTITRSKRYYAVAERRFKSRERLYVGKLILSSPDKALLDQLSEVMQQLSMRMGTTFLRSSYLKDIPYGYTSNPGVRHGESLFYTYDLIPLSPIAIIPPREDASGILLGTDEYGRPVHLDFKRLPNFHGIIVGSTGSGKSTLARSLILDLLEHGINSFVIDPHGEYRRVMEIVGGLVLDAINTVIDPLELHGVEPEVRVHSIASACDTIFNLTPIQRDILTETMLKMYRVKGKFTLADVLEELERRSYSREVKDLIARIRPAFTLFSEPNASITSMLDELKPIAFTYKTLEGRRLPLNVARFVTWIVLDQIYSYMEKRGIVNMPRIVVFVDEGHNLLSMGGEDSLIVRLYRETRKFGFSIITITQLPKDIPTSLYELAGFIIALTGDEKYVRSLSATLNLPEDIAEHIAFKGVGHGVVIRYGDPRPRLLTLRVREEAFKV